MTKDLGTNTTSRIDRRAYELILIPPKNKPAIVCVILRGTHEAILCHEAICFPLQSPPLQLSRSLRLLWSWLEEEVVRTFRH